MSSAIGGVGSRPQDRPLDR